MGTNWRNLTLENFRDKLPAVLNKLLDQKDSETLLLNQLPKEWSPKDVCSIDANQKADPFRLWELIGLWLMNNMRYFEAINVFNLLYKHLLQGQVEIQSRVHKGAPLLWISECFNALDYLTHAKRYLMLTLVEDSLTYLGEIDPNNTGSYSRLVWRYGLPGIELERYAKEFNKLAISNPIESRFPEWLLQEIDQKWMIEFPTFYESQKYMISEEYARFLINQLGESSGKILERLSSYFLSAIPGFRATTRRLSRSTDYDIVCAVEGPELDFRAELGRYFVCECKDWKDPADFSTIAKFCRVLDSTKCKFGILLSKNGVTGKNKGTDAEREQLKIYQDRGLVITILDITDFNFLANGGNFVTLLREKYEQIRLDLI